jgi:hypothetical protein
MEELDKMPWPEKNDVPFKSGDFDSTLVNLDWFTHFLDDAVIAEAFKEAADKVVENLELDKSYGHPDRFLFPVAYLYRHSIELNLKSILKYRVGVGIVVEDDNQEIYRGREAHNLHKLWNKARKVLEEAWPDGDKDTLINAERIILKFHEIDNSGQTFRYTKDVEGKPHFENAPKLIGFQNLKKVSNNILTFLESCIGGLSNMEDYSG